VSWLSRSLDDAKLREPDPTMGVAVTLVHLCNKNGYSMLWSSGHFQADKAQHLVYPSYCKDELFLTAALALGPRPRRMPRRVVPWGGD